MGIKNDGCISANARVGDFVITGLTIRGRWGFAVEITDRSNGEVLHGEIQTTTSNDPDFKTEVARRAALGVEIEPATI